MSNIISIFNQKGGSGKTTTAVSICGCLSKKFQDTNKKILLIDADPSAGATMDVAHKNDPEIDYANIIMQYCQDQTVINPQKAITETDFPNLYLMPASNTLGTAINAMQTYAFSANKIFTQIFEGLKEEYEYIIIDTMGSKHNILAICSLIYSDWALLPLEPEKKNNSSLKDSRIMLRAVQIEENKNLSVLGVFYTKVDERRNIDKICLESGPDLYGKDYIKTPIHQLTAVARNASFHSWPIEFYDSASKIASDYRKLTDEILKRLGGE